MKRKLVYNFFFIISLISLLSLSLEQVRIPTTCSYACRGQPYYYEKTDSETKKVTISITSSDTTFICTKISYDFLTYKSQYTTLSKTTYPPKTEGSTYVKYTFTLTLDKTFLMFEFYGNHEAVFQLSVDKVESSSSDTTTWIIGIIIVCICCGALGGGGTYYRRRRNAAIIIYD